MEISSGMLFAGGFILLVIAVAVMLVLTDEDEEAYRTPPPRGRPFSWLSRPPAPHRPGVRYHTSRQTDEWDTAGPEPSPVVPDDWISASPEPTYDDRCDDVAGANGDVGGQCEIPDDPP